MGNQQHDGFLKPDLRRVLTNYCRWILSLTSIKKLNWTFRWLRYHREVFWYEEYKYAAQSKELTRQTFRFDFAFDFLLSCCWIINTFNCVLVLFDHNSSDSWNRVSTTNTNPPLSIHPRRQMIGVIWWHMMISWAPQSTSSPPHWSRERKSLASGSRSWYRDVRESRAMATLCSPLCFYSASKASKRSPRISCHRVLSLRVCDLSVFAVKTKSH